VVLSMTGARTYGTIRTMAREVLPAHGTRYRYNHRTHACRCTKCRQANARYIQGWKASKRPDAVRSTIVTDSGRRLPVVQFALPFHRTQL